MPPKIAAQLCPDEPVPTGEKLGPNERHKYGAIWSPPVDSRGKTLNVPRPDWMIEMDCLRSRKKPRGYMGRAHHLRAFMSEIWGTPNDIFFLEWNPNAIEILDKYCQYQIVGVAGPASSGKSFIFSAIANVEFILFPQNTKVLITSFTKRASQGKIFGDVINCWNVAKVFFESQGIGMPGRLLQGQSFIRSEVNGINPKAGIELIAGDPSESKESAEKIQGAKNENLLVIGDEFATLPMSLFNTCMSNLRANPNSRLLAGFNPDTPFDPGGAIGKPKGGWHKVNVEMAGWETEVGGYCIHLDGEKSPNILDPREPWRGLMTCKMLAEMRTVFPKGTKRDDQMVRGWWSATGSKQSIYDLADIENYGADKRELRWVGPTVPVAGLDIGNAHGGDKTILTLGRAGMAKNDAGEIQVVCERVETLVLNEDMSLNDSLSEQIVKKVKYELQEGVWGPGTFAAGQKRSIPTANLAVDCTGGGTHFAALLARDIGSGFLMVGFGEAASDRRVSRNDKRKGNEAFANKVSELWGVPVQLIRTSQIRGLDPDLIFELTIRTYKDDGAKRMLIESKPEMKKRTNGKSPDRADSWVLMIEAARIRAGLSSTEKSAPGQASQVDRAARAKELAAVLGDGAEFMQGDEGGWGDG